MTTQAMERALSELPEGVARILEKTIPHLLDIGESVPEDIIGIINSRETALVITPKRIIAVAGGGGEVVIIPYAELSSVVRVGGEKKRFGGRDPIYFITKSLAGGERIFPLYGDYEHNFRLGEAAASACQKARLNAT